MKHIKRYNIKYFIISLLEIKEKLISTSKLKLNFLNVNIVLILKNYFESLLCDKE